MADSILDDASIALIAAANLPISLESVEEIIYDEVTSEAYFKRAYEHPEWPGGASGITVAIGYDLGYATRQKLVTDFGRLVPDDVLNAMLTCCGLKGTAAYRHMQRVRGQIVISWEAGLEVFLKRDMPEWIDTVQHVLTNTSLLSPTCLGVLVGLTYNRGASYSKVGDRYREMRAIADDMLSKNFSDIPHQLESMTRLWPEASGVHKRRFREAALFREGLLEMKNA